MFHLARKTPAGGSDAKARDPLHLKVRALNNRFAHHSANAVMQFALHKAGHVALVSSFGADSVVLLHMLAVIDKAAPVLFIDTEFLFTETLVHQVEVSERLGLRNLRIIRAPDSATFDPDRQLHKHDPDACCALRKTAPLQSALKEFDGWITGRKRFQAGTRAALEFFEADFTTNRMKINPLAHWSANDLTTYAEENRLPRHPLIKRGYPSIGCMPCTTPVKQGEDPRAGRWRNSAKLECGLHLTRRKETA